MIAQPGKVIQSSVVWDLVWKESSTIIISLVDF